MISPGDSTTPRAVRCHPAIFASRDRGREGSRGWIVAVGRPVPGSIDVPLLPRRRAGGDIALRRDARSRRRRRRRRRRRWRRRAGREVAAIVDRFPQSSPVRVQLAVLRRVRFFRGARNYAGSAYLPPPRDSEQRAGEPFTLGLGEHEAPGSFVSFSLSFLVAVSFTRLTSRGIIAAKPAVIPTFLVPRDRWFVT